MKKFLSIMLSVFMLMTFMPTMAFADEEDYFEDYTEIRIGAEHVTPSHLKGTGWNYNPSSKTLTFSNCTINPGIDEDGNEYAGIDIYDEGTINIKLEGENIVNLGSSASNSILNTSSGHVNVIGSGSLSGKTVYNSKNNQAGAIWVEDGSITFKDSVRINCTSNYGKFNSYGIHGYMSNITIQDNATLNCTSGKSNNYSSALYCYGTINIKDNATLNCTSGKSNNYSSALYCLGTINIKNNATVNAESGNVTKDGSKSVAIYAYNDINIDGSTKVNAESGTAKNIGYGICSDKGNINVSGGDINIKTSSVLGKKNKKNKQRGTVAIYANKKNINISGGTINAETASSKFCDCILASSGNLNITGGDITAIGGKATEKTSKKAFDSALACGKKLTIKNATVYAKTLSTQKNSFAIHAKKSCVIADTCNITAVGKYSFLQKPTLSNCTAVVLAGKSEAKAKEISKPSKNTYIKSKYINITTTAK